ncbi:uncharacterized protein B0H18DRAFT_1085167 [Fomitopsis serialis]|uniref:uncharacterized protein n=1 Tax=Fomitopsis serialis TaxID=139415 RepID=UPI0020081986|nr:uncharacterized protein B0H18DRAFT_1085167 [Neoantrodia serialis]KAH9926067.1 hypothetical protein B0H18DRAFT_1085167 [Neoantrodia serialis]
MLAPLSLLSSRVSDTYAAASYNSTLLDPSYTRLPTGAVKPLGWALDMAHVQANALEYSEMQEAAPYWYNGWVALAYQLQNETLLNYTSTFLDYVLDSQEPYMIMLGLIQHAEADPSQATAINDLMHNFVSYAAERFASGDLGTEDLGEQYGYQEVRWEELVLVLQWLYDNDPRGEEAQLISLMTAAREQGFSWKDDFYRCPRRTLACTSSRVNASHGVNVGESLKSEALAWRVTGEQSDVDSTYDRIGMLTDEHLAGLDPSRGSEYCTSVETMFSLEMIYATLGNPEWADLTEKIAYNSLPAQSTPDWWGHQYLQQTNQIWAWATDGPYSNVMGMEPNYPCCTVNHPQGWPKFWANSFLLADNGTSLVHALLGPATVSTALAMAQVPARCVPVTVDTLYPFGPALSYNITSTAPFTGSSISVNGSPASPLSPDPSSALQSVSVDTGETTVALYLDMQTQIEEGPNGSIAIHRGPLFYAVDLAYNDTETEALR